jgi:mannose-6-phosphate isomerase
MKKYPLKLTYTAKTALWAGTRLKEEFNKQTELERVSETWELSVREDEMARIVGGEADGMTLAEYFDKCGYDCVTPCFKSTDRFPLLVKLIDAADYLSVQVHPDDEFANRVENDSGKTEMWYIVDAKEDSKLIYGLRDGVSAQDFANAVKEGRIGDVISYTPVKKGETYFIPAGMLHAIGAGILIAEIQQNSDLTYRVYDFDRVGADGKTRELHVDKALAVTRPYSESEIAAKRFERGAEMTEGELLANSEYFKVRRLSIDGIVKLCATRDSFVSLLCVEGEGTIKADNNEYAIRKGDSFFVPAGMGEFAIEGELTVIISEV